MKLADQDEKRSLPPWLGPVGLFLLVVLTYLPVLKNGFVNWDDKDVLLDNAAIRTLDWNFLKWSFTSYATGNWMPLTWITFALEYRVAGLTPQVFHATNVLLHALNTLLVFGIALRLFKDKPWARSAGFLAALLFGLHPLHVESVAWATERKDVLYSLFYLGAIYLYLGPRVGKDRRLGACLVLYLLALLSKPMAVTLPLVFLILDFWPLQVPSGLFSLLKEKTAFWSLALASGLVTMHSHVKTLSYAQSGVEFYWVLNAFRSIVFYLMKMVLPLGLTAYYPFPPEVSAGYLLVNIGAMVAVVLVSVFLYRQRSSKPGWFAAWAYYLLTLLPVLGFVQTGAQAAADRYTYLPSLGPFLLAAAFTASRLGDRVRFNVVTLGLAVLLGGLTVRQIGFWKDTSILWERVTAVYPEENADAYSRLGVSYLKARRYDEALAAFSRASAIPPPMARTFHGLGTALLYKDRVPEAVQAFQYALTLDPALTAPRVNLWNIFERTGKHEEAIRQMEAALKLEPDNAIYWNNLGVSHSFLKQYGPAGKAFAAAHRLAPREPEYLVNLATLRQWEGRMEESLSLYRGAVARDPKEPVYHLKMGDLYLAQGKKVQAKKALQHAWELRPTDPRILQQLGEDFQALGEAQRAVECFEAEKKALDVELKVPSDRP